MVTVKTGLSKQRKAGCLALIYWKHLSRGILATHNTWYVLLLNCTEQYLDSPPITSELRINLFGLPMLC